MDPSQVGDTICNGYATQRSGHLQRQCQKHGARKALQGPNTYLFRERRPRHVWVSFGLHKNPRVALRLESLADVAHQD
jgi:hypothetical protein